MIKNSILFVSLLIVILQFGCGEMSDKERKLLLPASSGELAEVVVLTDSKTLDSAFRLEVDQVIGKNLVGYPPPGEKSFKILYTDETFFKGYFKKHHNIIVLLTEENEVKMSEIFGNIFVDKLLAMQDARPGILGVKQEELYAQNQNMFFVLAKDKAQLRSKFKEKSEEIYSIVRNQEVSSGKIKLLGSTRAKNDKFYQTCLTKRGFGVRKPSTYRVAIDQDRFVWMRKSSTTKEQENGILLFEAPYHGKLDLTTQNLLKIRNEYAQEFIPGEYDGSYMKYSTAITPIRTTQNFKGKYGVEIRGWWDVEGDFMGGPSYIRAVVDEASARIVFAEGFLFYPNENKAKPMRELEILVNTLSIK